MTSVQVVSSAVIGPGLPDWTQARAVLSGSAYVASETVIPHLEVLPPAERRRIGLPVKLAIAVGLQALHSAQREPARVSTVFTSSGGDGEVIQELCETLASAQRQVSPTKFHNSVHNAAAGYWSIATGSRAASTSLCAHDYSFAAGLLEATAQLATEEEQVLLIAYDVPNPEPLNRARPIAASFGVALLLSRSPSPGSRTLAVETAAADASADRMEDAALETLRAGNPSARSLPLLKALAGTQPARHVLEYLGGRRLAVALGGSRAQ